MADEYWRCSGCGSLTGPWPGEPPEACGHEKDAPCTWEPVVVLPVAEYERLRDALEDAVAHLDYCGWGDSYERECVKEDGTEERIRAALREEKP